MGMWDHLPCFGMLLGNGSIACFSTLMGMLLISAGLGTDMPCLTESRHLCLVLYSPCIAWFVQNHNGKSRI